MQTNGAYGPEAKYVREVYVEICRTIETAALHPDTDPAVIAMTQRYEVAKVVDDFDAAGLDRLNVAAISEAVILPEWVVWRRLCELGFDVPKPGPKVKARLGFGEMITAAVAYLDRKGRSTTLQISHGAALELSSLWKALTAHPKYFVRIPSGDARRGAWRNAEWEAVPAAVRGEVCRKFGPLDKRPA